VRSLNNSILYTSGEYFALCQATPCQINLRDPGDQEDEESIFDNIEYSITDDPTFQDTQIIEFDFITTDASSINITMNVTHTRSQENDTICHNSTIGSSGTINCNVPVSYQNSTYTARIYKDDEYIGMKVYTSEPTAQDTFGDIGIFLTGLGYLTLAFIAVSNPIASIILGLVGLVVMGLMVIIDGGSAFGIGSAFIWLFCAAAIMIWRIWKIRQ